MNFGNLILGDSLRKSGDGGEDLFVHMSGLKDNIRQNDQVTYNVEQGRNGLNATNVRIA